MVYTFEFLKSCDGNTKLERNDKVNEEYKEFYSMIEEYANNKSIDTDEALYRYITKLYFPEDEIVTLAQNRFPYDVESNVIHMVLWINPKYDKIPKNDLEYIRKLINLMLKEDNTVFTFYENSKKLRSVIKIKHFHVFVKKP